MAVGVCVAVRVGVGEKVEWAESLGEGEWLAPRVEEGRVESLGEGVEGFEGREVGVMHPLRADTPMMPLPVPGGQGMQAPKPGVEYEYPLHRIGAGDRGGQKDPPGHTLSEAAPWGQ